MRLTLLMGVLCAVPAFAGTSIDCSLDRGPGDVVEKDKDIVIETGVQNVVAAGGNITLKKGAHVKTVLATHGSVTVEAGAVVDEAIIAVGGKLVVDPKATVKGGRIVINDGIKVMGESGDNLSFDFTIDGKTLSQRIVEDIVSNVHGCKVVDVPKKG